ncbi:class I SAM-dependent methyltransferase [Lentzea sp.]|uniref:class I SAM-dependent methyltransferase n=1 Tax=Lentzea sp. TaxID=56099 RepID=UPI002BB62688|nr:class I SAM-dependent methyltransferase [Lentzea sp.]HUQ56473.1 class I SAM-dependent methyltransferase [Lentzea sp.]
MLSELSESVVDAVVVGDDEAVATAHALLDARGSAQVVVITAAEGPDPRAAIVNGTVTGLERLPGRGFRLDVSTPAGRRRVTAATLAVPARDDLWQARLAELGAMPAAPAPSTPGVRQERDTGPVEVDLHGESSVSGLFVLDGRAAEVGRRMAHVQERRATQSTQDRMVYDLMWSVDKERVPDAQVVDTVTGLLATRRGAPIRFADLGCGVGRNALYAAARGLQVVAVDHSSRAIAQLRRTADRLGLPVEAVEADFLTWLDGKPEPADIVACVSAVHHVSPDPDVVGAVLRRVAEVVAPGGYAYVALLTDIRYGDLPAPPGRLMVSAAEGEELLRSSLVDLDVVDLEPAFVRHDDVVLMDHARGEFVRSFYECVRVDALLHRSG